MGGGQVYDSTIVAQVGIESPLVAVVGDSGSGKSSVLETLVGRDFLPRSSTRRPLVVQLVQTKINADDSIVEEWGEFSHLPGLKFFDFDEIRDEIQAETECVAGLNNQFSDKQIFLKIFSPNVLDVTLVDLPTLECSKAHSGMTIMSYIKRPSCLILAVMPANSDLTSSLALQLAELADPESFRTIGVITKLDIMDRHSLAIDFLLGKVFPLRLGHIGVLNHNQRNIQMKPSFEDALISKGKLFRRRQACGACGATELAKKVNKILEQNIKPRLS